MATVLYKGNGNIQFGRRRTQIAPAPAPARPAPARPAPPPHTQVNLPVLPPPTPPRERRRRNLNPVSDTTIQRLRQRGEDAENARLRQELNENLRNWGFYNPLSDWEADPRNITIGESSIGEYLTDDDSITSEPDIPIMRGSGRERKQITTIHKNRGMNIQHAMIMFNTPELSNTIHGKGEKTIVGDYYTPRSKVVKTDSKQKVYSDEQLEKMGFNEREIDIIDEKLYGRGKRKHNDGVIYGEGSLPAETIKKYGQIASIAYQPNNNVIKELEKYNQTGWTLDSSLSDKEKKVIYKGDEVVVSYRGTDSTKDVLNDLSLLLGLDKIFSPRKSKERKHYKKVLKKYKGKKINLTGHSLGGKSVMNIILKYPTEFNKAYMINGASVHDTSAPLKLKAKNKLNDVYNIRVKIDPVSVLNPFQEVKVKQSKGDPHTVYNFV